MTAGQVGEHEGSSAGLTRSSPMPPPRPSLFNPRRLFSVIDSFSLAVMWKRSVSGLRCESSTLLPAVFTARQCLLHGRSTAYLRREMAIGALSSLRLLWKKLL